MAHILFIREKNCPIFLPEIYPVNPYVHVVCVSPKRSLTSQFQFFHFYDPELEPALRKLLSPH